jgi:predicted Zn-dependent protease
MRKIFDILFLVAIMIVAFYYKDTLKNIWTQAYQQYFPCRSPITYSIGIFDDEFGISKSDFLTALSEAEQIWEKPINKNLFAYSQKGNLKINLIYDLRQEATVKIQQMGISVNNTRASYDQLKTKYDSLNADYLYQKAVFDAEVADFEKNKTAYENEVSFLNKKGRANQQDVARLDMERKNLNEQAASINQMQNSLNSIAGEINSLVLTLNQLAKTLNINVEKINTVGASLGGEFNEGMYKSDAEGQEIDVYQFSSRTKLIRVLAHELGHALWLNHVDDPKAIMYRLNNGVNEKLTNTDLIGLKEKCGIK